MDNLDTLYDLCEVVSHALKDANERIKHAGGKLTAGDAELLDKYTHILKSLKTSIAMDEEQHGDYSGRDSYARGDRTGRVHWQDGSVSYGDNYGRDRRDRYSRDSAKTEMIDRMREMMYNADPAEKAKYQRIISDMEQM